MSLGESEKKAISLPEIKAEESINIAKKAIEKNTPVVSSTKFA